MTHITGKDLNVLKGLMKRHGAKKVIGETNEQVEKGGGKVAKTKYRMHPDGEEFMPYEEHDDPAGDTYREGREQHPVGPGMHVKGHVSRIEKSEHDGHHRITIDHPHLAKGDDDDNAISSTPSSTVHVPKGHGLQVGHRVKVHVSREGRDSQDVVDEEG